MNFFIILRALGDFFIRFLPFSLHRGYRFAFLIHSRDITDIYRKFPFAEKLPDSLVKFRITTIL